MDLLPEAKFEHGQIVATRTVHEYMQSVPKFRDFVAKSLARYFLCDWGDTCEDDKKLNDEAVKNGERILAAYIFDFNLPPRAVDQQKIWIITEWDRSVTTILFPEEY